MRPATRKSTAPMCEPSSAPSKLRAIRRKSAAVTARLSVLADRVLDALEGLVHRRIPQLALDRNRAVGDERGNGAHRSQRRSEHRPDDTGGEREFGDRDVALLDYDPAHVALTDDVLHGLQELVALDPRRLPP